MCKWGIDKEVKLYKRKKHSRLLTMKVDVCLAPLIQILNDYGIETIASCCGHGKIKHSHIRIHPKNILLTEFGDTFSVHLKFPYREKINNKEK